VYHPYNPARVQTLLDLLRLRRNWCAPGEDGRPPAMRVGVADRPLELAEVLEAAGEDLREARAAESMLRERREARKERRPAAARAEPSPSLGMGM